MPGKGIDMEKNVPFKMITEYADVLGGDKSHYFDLLRKYLFQGFKAVIKNQHRILDIVKMIYSCHGVNLPCFKEGDKTITDLYHRLNPINNKDKDPLLNQFIQQYYHHY
jgi:phosphatidylinositol 4-kinase